MLEGANMRLGTAPVNDASAPEVAAVRQRRGLPPRRAWGAERERALLFKNLATLRTDAPVFRNVDELGWRGPTGAEQNRLKNDRAPDELGGPVVFLACAPSPHRPYHLRFPTPNPNKRCTA